MKVNVEPYNPEWPLKFRKVQERLQGILQNVPVITIEHVGSTSIPLLRAKPVLDIDIIVKPSALEAARTALASAGYTDCGEMGVPGRFAFRQPGYGLLDFAHGLTINGELRQNTYVILEGCTALRNHLDIKRVLTENENLREEYARFKADLAERDFGNIDEYCIAKTEVLCKILRIAGWSEEELEPVIRANMNV
ncbi:hypothetical protein N7532_006003 [Penicillium argentinense]|uniref:GrpB family protein n=1 Tax=Penicillium argentinense TaxID=1131581 RepID=A0A9W9KBJ1_9EURO|nr:uncharacterized protein N7532_006003 [Penicillium argentinense]KAJ5099002.1 hypothetical protein N7532_006003 [Penicillium argentinense]